MSAELRSETEIDFTKNRSQMLIIEAVRLGFLVVILAITLGFQALQPNFVNVGVLTPVYSMMSVTFALHAFYIFYFARALRRWFITAFFFAYDAVFITGLIYFTGITQSIFLFLYLVNIILCGFVFKRKGAYFLALATSICFSALMIFGPDLKGQTLFFAVTLNNLAFFAIAALSGYLSEQLNFMGLQLVARGRDLTALRNLNELVLQNIATGLITIDNDGFILQYNRAAKEVLHTSGVDHIGRNVDDILPDLMMRIRMWNWGTGNRRAERFDFPRVFDGERQTLEMVVSSFSDGGQNLSGFVVAFEDHTHVRKLEYAMRQSEKLAAVGQLAAGIAHEIRNPLASISGSIQLLGGSFTSRQEEEKRLMAIVLREIDRLNNLISEFLDYVKPDQVKDEAVDCNALLREVLEIARLNQALRKDVQLTVVLQSTAAITGHRDKLKQAFLNIVINAYQAMQDATSPTLRVECNSRDNMVVVKIRDSGTGIDAKNLKKIFEPFHTTKAKGTGLGLAMTFKIVESHGGKIYVDSELGRGTEFTIEFPARREQLGLAENGTASDDLKSMRAVRVGGNG